MNLAETHDLLTLAAAYDNRRFDDAAVHAWREVLERETFADCRAALVEHFTTSDAYLMPVHVARGAAALRRQRAEFSRHEPELPPAVALAERSANGQLEQLRDVLPATRGGILRRAEWYAQDRARERALTAVPNPHFTGPPPPEGHPLPEAESEAS